MNDIAYVIRYSIDMLNDAVLYFQPFHFTLGQVLIAFLGLYIVAFSIRELFLN